MRILVHDYCGHPFQIGLSRQFARMGHQVCHSFSTDIESPRGDLSAPPSANFFFAPLGLGRPVPKYDLVRRSWHEWRYAQLAVQCARTFKPDIVLSGNAPPTIQQALQGATHRLGGAFIFWVQDIYSALLEQILPQRSSALTKCVTTHFRRYEFGVMAQSDAVIVISEDFVPCCVVGGVPPEKIHVRRNWAPVGEITPRSRDNAWAQAHGLADKFVFLFSGTLGLKHNPWLLADLAAALQQYQDAVVVVVSQGAGRQWLEREVRARKLDNLMLLDFQPFAALSDVLASGDVMVALLQTFAGNMSVPSKVLSYLCANRPLLAALPSDNLASRTIQQAEAGIIVPPDDGAGFIAAAMRLMDRASLRARLASSARAYAEATFDIEAIAESFVAVFRAVCGTQRDVTADEARAGEAFLIPVQ